MGKDCKISLTSILHKKSGQQNVSFLLIEDDLEDRQVVLSILFS